MRKGPGRGRGHGEFKFQRLAEAACRGLRRRCRGGRGTGPDVSRPGEKSESKQLVKQKCFINQNTVFYKSKYRSGLVFGDGLRAARMVKPESPNRFNRIVCW